MLSVIRVSHQRTDILENATPHDPVKRCRFRTQAFMQVIISLKIRTKNAHQAFPVQNMQPPLRQTTSRMPQPASRTIPPNHRTRPPQAASPRPIGMCRTTGWICHAPIQQNHQKRYRKTTCHQRLVAKAHDATKQPQSVSVAEFLTEVALSFDSVRVLTHTANHAVVVETTFPLLAEGAHVRTFQTDVEPRQLVLISTPDRSHELVFDTQRIRSVRFENEPRNHNKSSKPVHCIRWLDQNQHPVLTMLVGTSSSPEEASSEATTTWKAMQTKYGGRITFQEH